MPLLKPDRRHAQVALPDALWPLMKQKRWLVWKRLNGKKPPIDRYGNCIDANNSENWMTFIGGVRPAGAHW